MAGHPAGFMFWVADWRSSRRVRRMGGEERGAYLEILVECWDAGYVLATDDELAVIWPWTSSKEDRDALWSKVRPCLVEHEAIPDAYYSRRLEEERVKARDKADARKVAAKHAAEARWEAERTAKAADEAMELRRNDAERNASGMRNALPPACGTQCVEVCDLDASPSPSPSPSPRPAEPAGVGGRVGAGPSEYGPDGEVTSPTVRGRIHAGPKPPAMAPPEAVAAIRRSIGMK